MKKLTLEDLQSLFTTPRGDHPSGRRGQSFTRGSGGKSRNRISKRQRREAARNAKLIEG